MAKKKKLSNKLTRLKERELPRLERYNKQLKIIGQGRKSYSKTDPDATFMRMKEDHMRNGQLKPAYNVQLATQNQFILHIGAFQNRTDTLTLIPFLKSYYQLYGSYPSTVIADAGYGSEANYRFLSQNKIEAYVKYNWFDKEGKIKYQRDISRSDNFYYNEQEDYLVCAMGQKLLPVGEKTPRDKQGRSYQVTVYQAQNCQGCPLRSRCQKTKGNPLHNRRVEFNKQLWKYKQQVRQLLLSQQGQYYRKRRMVEVETVFGQIKHNKGFRRFYLRGMEKVKIELGLIAIAHNIEKLWRLLNKHGSGGNGNKPNRPDKRKPHTEKKAGTYFLFIFSILFLSLNGKNSISRRKDNKIERQKIIS